MKVRISAIFIPLFILLSLAPLFLTGCITIRKPTGTTDAPDQTTLAEAYSPPVISQFTASPDGISAGDTCTLTWSISDATSATIDNGIGSVALNGSRSVSPNETTIYTITATGRGGTNTATAQVTVESTSGSAPSVAPTYAGGLPVINYFNVSPVELTGSFSVSGTHKLSWDVSNALSVSITPGIGTVAATGSRNITPSSTTTYVLSAKNAYGIREKSVTVSNVSGVAHVSWADEQVAYDFI